MAADDNAGAVKRIEDARTICDLLRVRARLSPDEPALHQPRGSRTQRTYETFTWRHYHEAVNEIAAGLLDLGVGKGDIVVLDSDSHAEFYIFDLAVMACGAASAALYPTSPPKEKLKLIERCRAKALICQDAISAARLASAKTGIRALMRGEAPGAESMQSLRQRGQELLSRDPDAVDRAQAAIRPEDDAIIYLTSGATGEPKIVVSSHGAVVANVLGALSMIDVGPGDSGFAFLPSAHIAQRLVAEIAAIAAGVPVWFADSLNTVAEEIQQVAPTAMVAPPQVWDRVRRRIHEAVERESPTKQRIFHAAVRAGMRRSRLSQAGERVPLWLHGACAVYDRLVFSKLRDRVGGKLRLAISGAAPLAEDLAHFWAALGIRLTEGYGLTEAGVLTFNTPGGERFGSVGQPLPGVELKLEEDGELLVRGPYAFSRYLDDEETTSAVLRDRWLYTGDVASIDAHGFVTITGRKKEIIVSSSGKNIFPAAIEELFRADPLIANAFLVGDSQPHLCALLTLHPTVARSLPGMEEHQSASNQNLHELEPVRKELERIVRKVNRHLSTAERVHKFRALPRDFSIEKGEVTPTLKLRRKVILEHFRDEIAELYAE